MKIGIIGPVSPFRGGICHSNEVLSKNLSKKHNVTNISFRRLFPKIIYPGKFQAQGKNNGTLDSINPINWIFEKRNMKDKDILIFQWWTTFLTPCYLFLASNVKAKKVAICQNVFPHSEGKLKFIVNPMNRFLSKLFLRKMDRIVAMSKSDRKIVQKLFPTKKTGIYFEPMYDLPELKKNSTTKEKAKQSLGLKGNVLLFFGFVREYKGLKYLLEAMPEIIDKTNATLLIVGEFWENKEKYDSIIKSLGISEKIIIVDSYVPDSKVGKYFLAADLLVLPYTAISESGVIRMAFNFNTPILSTNVGGNPDHIENGLNGFLVPPKDAKAIAKSTSEFFRKKLSKKLFKGMIKKKKELEWSEKKEAEILGQ